MHITDFEKHLDKTGFKTELKIVGNEEFLVIKNVNPPKGSHAGTACDVGIKRTTETPWVPQSAVHVSRNLVKMGEKSSQASTLGPEWQYLSRRFDRAPNPKAFLAHILTVLGET
jgi:hypothetical protein